MGVFAKEDLTGLAPKRTTLVGIDSDGCVFDTMEVKQKQFFHSRIARFWGLEPIETYVRRVAEFVNLYSRWRGSNRFPALLKVFELLHDWPEVVRQGVALPDCAPLEKYVNSGLPLGNPSLQAEVERTNDPELRRVLAWSLDINAAITARMPPIPPFQWARRSLEEVARQSDAIVVSQTPEEALVAEWRKHGIDVYVRVIAGQELGTKTEHLRMATKGRYAPGSILMIGDSLNDLKAAREAGALFYPISPGAEEDSWEAFLDDAYPRFLNSSFTAEYQQRLVAEFEAQLPGTPPWRK